MKYILLFLCILSLSCKYNVANPVGALKDYTEGSGIIYYVSSSAPVSEIEEALRKNKHSLGKYKIVVSTSSDASTKILTNIAKAISNNTSFNPVEVDISKLEITEIPEGVFKGLGNLSSIMLSDNVSNIGNNAFSGCSSLNNVRFSNGLTNISDGAFSNCSSLTFASLDSSSLKTIGKNAFSGCSSLVNIILSASLTNICNDAFSNCSKLANVEYLGKTNSLSNCSPFSNSRSGNSSNPSNLYLPNASDTNGFTNFLGNSWSSSNIHTNKHIPN